MRIKTIRAKKGLTLIELCAVLVLVSVLAMLGAPIFLQSWRISAAGRNPMPLSKTMLALSDMDRLSTCATDIKFVKFAAETGIPSAATPVEAEALAFHEVAYDTETAATTSQWIIYKFTQTGIFKLTGNALGSAFTSREIYNGTRIIFAASCGTATWRTSNAAVGYFNVRLHNGIISIELPFACIMHTQAEEEGIPL